MKVVVYSPKLGNFQIFLWSWETVEVKSGAKEILQVLLSGRGVPVYKLEDVKNQKNASYNCGICTKLTK